MLYRIEDKFSGNIIPQCSFPKLRRPAIASPGIVLMVLDTISSCHKSVITSEIVSIFKPSSNARLDKFDKLNPFSNAPLSYTAIPGITYVMPRLFMCKDSIDFSNFSSCERTCVISPLHIVIHGPVFPIERDMFLSKSIKPSLAKWTWLP